MQIYYAPEVALSSLVKLDETESGHLVRVMRQKPGDEVRLFDGKGRVYRGVLISGSPKEALVRADTLLQEETGFKEELNIAIAPTKQAERWEWFLEKSTELGVNAIWPFYSSRSERRQLQEDRSFKIICSAAKQSLQWNLPDLKKIKSFRELLSEAVLPGVGRYIAILHQETKPLAEVYKKGESALVLVGPEGDFTEEEMDLAIQSGFIPVSLGKSRLRVETAGVYLAAHHRYLNQH